AALGALVLASARTVERRVRAAVRDRPEHLGAQVNATADGEPHARGSRPDAVEVEEVAVVAGALTPQAEEATRAGRRARPDGDVLADRARIARSLRTVGGAVAVGIHVIEEVTVDHVLAVRPGDSAQGRVVRQDWSAALGAVDVRE